MPTTLLLAPLPPRFLWPCKQAPGWLLLMAIFVHQIMVLEEGKSYASSLWSEKLDRTLSRLFAVFFFSFPAEKAFIKAECSAKKPRWTQSSLLQVLAQHTFC